MAELRSLVLVLGDQLDLEASAYDGFDARVDAAWMAEVAEESTHVVSSRPRTVMFLAAMRHFAQALQAADRPLHYTRLDAPGNRGSLAAQLQADIERLRPARLVVTAPGDWRVLQAVKTVAEACGLPLEIREDRHFCRYDPAQRTGDNACPFTTLYWDFLMRHEATLAKNPRMLLQVKNLSRMNATQRQDVVARAAAIRRGEVGVAAHV